MAKVVNPRWPHTCRIWRLERTDAFDEEAREVEVYSGACRSYTRNQTSHTGDVITSTRTLSIPVSTGEWGTVPETGDLVEVLAGNLKEEGTLLDFVPNNFGTDVTWRRGRN